MIETGEVTTPVSMIFHGIKHLNEALSIWNYFFKDIKKEELQFLSDRVSDLKRLTAEIYQEKITQISEAG